MIFKNFPLDEKLGTSDLSMDVDFNRLLSNRADLKNYALVCESWYKAAQRQIYSFVCIPEHGLGAVDRLHSTLTSEGSVLALHVLRLDVYADVRAEESLQKLAEVVQLCTRLRRFFCASTNARRLAQTRLKAPLRLDAVGLSELKSTRTTNFARIAPLFDAYAIRYLQLDYSTLYSNASDFVLPNLETLKLHCPTMHPRDNKPFFPTLKGLKRLTITGDGNYDQVEHINTTLVIDYLLPSLGQSLTSLTLTHLDDLSIRDSHLPLLPHLVHLECRVRDFDHEDMPAIEEEVQTFEGLPATLESLVLHWLTSYEQAMRLFGAFQSPTFLPKLKSVPQLARLRHRYHGLEHQFEVEKDRARKVLIQRGLAGSLKELCEAGTLRPSIWAELPRHDLAP